MDTPFWTATFSREQGLISLLHKASGKELLNGAVRFVAMKDRPNAWGSDFSAIFNEPFAPLEILSPAEVGAFIGAETREGPGVRVITDGAVWVTVECLSGWAHTRASLRFTLYADLPHIDLNTTLYMNARAKMLKLQFPFTAWTCRPSAEIPYGVAQYPADASEYPFSRWVRLDSHHLNVGVANNGLNGFDVNADGKLNLSVARGAIHGSPLETDADPNKSYTFMDQEQISTKFRIVAGTDRAETARALVAAAQELNHPLEKFFAYYAPTRTSWCDRAVRAAAASRAVNGRARGAQESGNRRGIGDSLAGNRRRNRHRYDRSGRYRALRGGVHTLPDPHVQDQQRWRMAGM